MARRNSRQHRQQALPHDGRFASRGAHGSAAGSEAPAAPRPDWDEISGELRFRDEVLIERGRKLAPVVEALLTALATDGWKPSTRDPVPPPHRDSQHPVAQLRQAVKRVKASLRLDWLDFHVHELTVSWEDRVATGRAQSPPPQDARNPRNWLCAFHSGAGMTQRAPIGACEEARGTRVRRHK